MNLIMNSQGHLHDVAVTFTEEQTKTAWFNNLHQSPKLLEGKVSEKQLRIKKVWTTFQEFRTKNVEHGAKIYLETNCNSMIK